MSHMNHHTTTIDCDGMRIVGTGSSPLGSMASAQSMATTRRARVRVVRIEIREIVTGRLLASSRARSLDLACQMIRRIIHRQKNQS